MGRGMSRGMGRGHLIELVCFGGLRGGGGCVVFLDGFFQRYHATAHA